MCLVVWVIMNLRHVIKARNIALMIVPFYCTVPIIWRNVCALPAVQAKEVQYTDYFGLVLRL